MLITSIALQANNPISNRSIGRAPESCPPFSLLESTTTACPEPDSATNRIPSTQLIFAVDMNILLCGSRESLRKKEVKRQLPLTSFGCVSRHPVTGRRPALSSAADIGPGQQALSLSRPRAGLPPGRAPTVRSTVDCLAATTSGWFPPLVPAPG